MRGYLVASGVVFSLIALVNLGRILMGWPMDIGTLQVPTGFSWAPVVVAGTLAAWAFVLGARLSRRSLRSENLR